MPSRRPLHILALAALLLASLSAPHGAEVIAVAPWELHSSFWMSLHQRLIEDAMRSGSRPLDTLSSEEKEAWTAAVAAYRDAGGSGNMTFAGPMAITTDALTQVADDATSLGESGPLAEALRTAAPVYRAHRWPEDERAGRFFIHAAAGLLRGAAEPLIVQHERVYGSPWPELIRVYGSPWPELIRVYGSPWPELIRVYVTPAAGPYGAYTLKGLSGGLITTMSCRDEGYQGLRALEMLFHEASHDIVGPNRDPVAEAIKAAAQARGMPVPRDLWHAILFATSSELTRRALADLGVTDYGPASVDLFERVWPQYREPVTTHWLPYLQGTGTLQVAIAAIIGDLHGA